MARAMLAALSPTRPGRCGDCVPRHDGSKAQAKTVSVLARGPKPGRHRISVNGDGPSASIPICLRGPMREGARVIVPQGTPLTGVQLDFTDLDGYRSNCFATNRQRRRPSRTAR
jgi:hypothetical protein